jgi:hypothetical protein
MYLEHVFPHYTWSNTERALTGSGVAFPPIDGRLLDPNIARLIATGYLRAPGQPPPTALPATALPPTALPTAAPLSGAEPAAEPDAWPAAR